MTREMERMRTILGWIRQRILKIEEEIKLDKIRVT